MTIALRYLPVALLLALWETSSRLGFLSEDVLPSLNQVMVSLGRLTASGELAAHVAASLLRAGSGLGLSILVGLPLGVMIASSRLAARLVQPSLNFLYPLPKSALIPVIMIWLGFGHAAQVAVIFLGCLLPIILGAFNGTRGVDRTLVWSARGLGATPIATLRQVVVRAALPDMLSGIRVALALSFVLLVSSEMIGARRGMGFLISFLGEGGDYAGMFAATFVVIAIGFGADRVYLVMQRYLLRWREA